MTSGMAVDTPRHGRRSLMLRNAYIVTLDPRVGDIQCGDVLVRDGVIESVGKNLDARGTEEIDLSGTILMPGFVDTHFHLWNSTLRGVISRVEPDRGYFPIKRALGPHFLPDDSYWAARLGLLEALEAGITTVNNWNHNLRSPSDADANIRAQRDSGLRTRLSYGNPDALDPGIAMDMSDVLRLLNAEQAVATAPEMLGLGVALRGPTRTKKDVLRKEWQFARAHDLPITLHVGGNRSDTARYADLMEMYRDGLLGPDVQLVHAVDANSTELEAMAATDTSLSLAWGEFGGMGIPPLREALEAGIRVSFSTDTVAGPGAADMFLTMRMFVRMERHRDRSSPVDERRVLEIATIGGAQDLRIDHLTGSISEGKRADLIAVSVAGTHMGAGLDPVALLVHCARPEDVCLVMCDGKILKQGRDVLAFDPRDIRDGAGRSLRAIIERSGWQPQQPIPAVVAPSPTSIGIP